MSSVEVLVEWPQSETRDLHSSQDNGAGLWCTAVLAGPHLLLVQGPTAVKFGIKSFSIERQFAVK